MQSALSTGGTNGAPTVDAPTVRRSAHAPLATMSHVSASASLDTSRTTAPGMRHHGVSVREMDAAFRGLDPARYELPSDLLDQAITPCLVVYMDTVRRNIQEVSVCTCGWVLYLWCVACTTLCKATERPCVVCGVWWSTFCHHRSD